jgi:hypothetical protein
MNCKINYKCSDKAGSINCHKESLLTSDYFQLLFKYNTSDKVTITTDFKSDTLIRVINLLHHKEDKTMINYKDFLKAVLYFQLDINIVIVHLLDILLSKCDYKIIQLIIHAVMTSDLPNDIKNNFFARTACLLRPHHCKEMIKILNFKNPIFYNKAYHENDRLIVSGHWAKLIYKRKFDNVDKELYFSTNKVNLEDDVLNFQIGCENGEDSGPFQPPSYSCNATIKLLIYDGVTCESHDIIYISDFSNQEMPIRLPGYAAMGSHLYQLPRVPYTHCLENKYNKHMVHEYVITFLK